MGSFRHRKVFDSVTQERIRETFYDILAELDPHGDFFLSDRRLKATIIERLLHLATHDTRQHEWKAKVLVTLPGRRREHHDDDEGTQKSKLT